MAKNKIKKKFNKLNSIAIVLIAILFSMSIGYCIWTDNQTIIGNFILKYKEPRLVDISVLEEDGYYITIDEGNKPIDAYELKKGTLVDNEDKIEVIGKLDTYNDLISIARKVNISFSFVNNTGYTLTSVEYEKLPKESNEDEFGYDTTISVPDNIAPGETATSTVSFKIKAITYPYKKDRNGEI